MAIGGVACACGSNHHVSPWPDQAAVRSLLQPTDLRVQLARIDEEMRTEQLELETAIDGELEDGERFVLRGYGGQDALGRRRDAVRVATRFGVVMAVGPVDIAERTRGAGTRLREALSRDGKWRSGTDFNGDRLRDVVVAADDGTFEIWGLHARGAAPYPVQSARAPDRALDVNGDGRPELACGIRLDGPDPLELELLEVMAFSAGAYRYDTPTILAYHDRMRRVRATEREGDREGEAGAAPVRVQLALAVEGAWHALRAGAQKSKALDEADREVERLGPLPAELREAWGRWRRWLALLDARTSSRGTDATSCDAPAVRVQSGPPWPPRSTGAAPPGAAMSIHRPKRVSYRSRDSENALDSSPGDKPMSWAEATEGKSDADFKAYNVKTTFAQGDLVRHPKFGGGVVVGVEASKIEVLFQEGERKLVHAMGG